MKKTPLGYVKGERKSHLNKTFLDRKEQGIKFYPNIFIVPIDLKKFHPSQ